MQVELSNKWSKYSVEGPKSKIYFWVRCHYCRQHSEKIKNIIRDNINYLLNNDLTSLEALDHISWQSGIIIKMNNSVFALSPFHGMEVLYVDQKKNIITDNWLLSFKNHDVSSLRLYERLGFLPGLLTFDSSVIKLINGYGVIAKNETIEIIKNFPGIVYGSEAYKMPDVCELNQILKKTIDKLKSRCVGKDIYLSLSGGRDSILLACLMKREGVKFECFTYGLENNSELVNAKKVCKILDLRHHVLTSRKQDRSTPDVRLSYSRGFRAPSETGFYAVQKIVSTAENDIVIVDGQTGDWLSGGHLTEITDVTASFNDLLCKHLKQQSLTLNGFEESAIAHSLYSELKYFTVNSEIKNKYLSKYYEYLIEQNIRQTYIVNPAMRILENEMLIIESPLWDSELVKYFSSLSPEALRQQVLYKKYCKQFFPDIFENFKDNRVRNKSLIVKGLLKCLKFILPGSFYNASKHISVFKSHYSDQVAIFKNSEWLALFQNYPFISDGRTVLQLLTLTLSKEIQKNEK